MTSWSCRRHSDRIPFRARRDELRRRRRRSAGGRGRTIADVEHFDSRYHEIQDVWRSDRDTFVRSAEERFAMDEGYGGVMRNALSAPMATYG